MCVMLREEPVTWKDTTLYFRGAKILDVMIDNFLTLGGDEMEQIILTGCSGTPFNCKVKPLIERHSVRS